MKDTVQNRIQELLSSDGIGAQAFSQILFGPNGLFQQLATTEIERQAVVQSPLFQKANERLTALQQLELAKPSLPVRSAKMNGPASPSKQATSEPSS